VQGNPLLTPVLGAVLSRIVSKGMDGGRFERALDGLRLIADPVLRVDAIRVARERVEALEADAVREARGAGVTWKAIGALYGLSKQGAQQRFRDVRRDDE
jgi:hypothetical protein